MRVGILLRSLGLGLAATALTLGLALALILGFVLLLSPGHDGAFYQAFAARVAPFLLAPFGLASHALAGRIAARGRGFAMGMVAALPYPVVDAALTAAGGSAWLASLAVWPFVIGGVAIGAWSVRTRALPLLEGPEPEEADLEPAEPITT